MCDAGAKASNARIVLHASMPSIRALDGLFPSLYCKSFKDSLY
ncbi:hypothetical protein GCWU000341_00861 [Oribacterium sp. oral taxon 078 str. F0262]|nr:hypothetical protein GCWU000341_00861 [Oribacterium sp. oral taxon 078 str. F0262]